jgi:uncharacterized membrane protein
VTVLGAMLLALVCVGWLLFFIHHISRSISVNHIVDRIARETELVIDELMPQSRGSHYRPVPALPEPVEREFPILNEVSGYIRFIHTRRLVEFARTHQLRLRVTRQVGHFVPAGVPLLMVDRRARIDRDRAVELTGAFADPLDRPLPARVSLIQTTERLARRAAMDRPGRNARHRDRADSRLRHK